MLLIAAAIVLPLLGSVWAAAQDAPAETVVDAATCAAGLENWYVQASEACIGGARDHFCNGGLPPGGEPMGPVIHSLGPPGSMVPVDAVQALRTPPLALDGSSGGVAWIRVGAIEMSGLLIGDTTIYNVAPEDFADWQAMVVVTAPEDRVCEVAPRNAFIAQNSTAFQSTRIVINGVSLDLNGTVMVQTQPAQTLFIVLEGRVRVISGGESQALIAGESVRVPYNDQDFMRPAGLPEPAQPFDYALASHFPIELLDRPALLPQPGTVVTEGAVNMRTAPNTDASLIFQVPPGQVMSVLGTNPDGDWLHVRLVTGQTGWMFGDLLRRNLGPVNRTYTATPEPPQRLGDLGYTARIQAGAGVNLREAPDVGFNPVASLSPGQEVRLVARSPYSPWVKIDAQGMVGWVALIALETQSIIESLPIDWDVPPPPEPTLVPGSWGGAFPDPDCFPNC